MPRRLKTLLRTVGKIYRNAGLTAAAVESLSGRELGIAVAEAMLEFGGRIGFPMRLSQVEGFSQARIGRALTAAKNPQLKMKLQNMDACFQFRTPVVCPVAPTGSPLSE